MDGYFTEDMTSGECLVEEWRDICKNNLLLDMMITLTNTEQSLSFAIIDKSKSLQHSIPIHSKNVEWSPHFIFYGGGNKKTKFTDTYINVFEIDPDCFGKLINHNDI